MKKTLRSSCNHSFWCTLQPYLERCPFLTLLAALPGPAPLLRPRAAGPHGTPLPDPNPSARGNYSSGAAPPSLSYQTISARLLYTNWLMNKSGPESPVSRRPPRDLERTAGAAGGAKQRRAGGAEPRAERQRPPGPRSPRGPASHLQAAPAAPFRSRPSFSSPSRRPARTLAPPPALRAPRRAPGRRASAPAAASRGAARRCGKRVRGCAESRSAAGGGRRAFPMIGAPLRTAPPSDPRPSPAAPRLLRRVGFQSLWRPLCRR